MFEMLKRLKRYAFSLRAFIWIVFFSIRTRGKRSLICNKKVRRVFIICPGPGAAQILEEDLFETDGVILINHAVKLAEHIKHTKNVYYFSLDYSRTDEFLKSNSVLFSKVVKIFVPYHFFQLVNYKLIKNIDVVLMPSITFDLFFGLKIKNVGANNFKGFGKFFCATGYGTLASSLQLVANFSPEEVIFIGCDFGKIDDSQYFDKTIPIRHDTPFDLIRRDVNIILKKNIFNKVTIK